MSTSRRDFLKRGTVVALAAGVPLTVAEAAFGSKDSSNSPESQLSKKQFAAQLNTEFVFANGRNKVKTKLIEVSDLNTPSHYAPRLGKEGFSLLFRGERANALKQNTYIIEHPKLGTFSFLIVPAKSKDEGSVYYEAVVNRLYP